VGKKGDSSFIEPLPGYPRERERERRKKLSVHPEREGRDRYFFLLFTKKLYSLMTKAIPGKGFVDVGERRGKRAPLAPSAV